MRSVWRAYVPSGYLAKSGARRSSSTSARSSSPGSDTAAQSHCSGDAMTDSGRETRAYVSAFDRSRLHQSRLYRFEQRLLGTYIGSLLGERLLRCALWSIDRPEIGLLS